MRARHENTLTVCILSALPIFAALECGVVCGCAPSFSRPHKSPAPSPPPPPNSKPSPSASTVTEPAPFKESPLKANHTNSPQTPTPSSAAKTPRPPRSPTSSPSPVSYFLASLSTYNQVTGFVVAKDHGIILGEMACYCQRVASDRRACEREARESALGEY